MIDFVENVIDSGTGTVTVRGEVPNGAKTFRPGYFARVRVPMSDKYQAVLVADRAIGTQQGQKYVLVVDSKNTVIFKPVKLGALQPDGLRVVTSGLAAGERIVVNGMQRARPGAPVKAESEPMPTLTTKPTTAPSK